MFLCAPPLLGREARERRRSSATPAARRRAPSASTTPAARDRRRRDRRRRQRRRPRATSASATTRASPSTPPTRGPSSRAQTERYDLILIDAYRQPYVPFYLATREFFELARRRLRPRRRRRPERLDRARRRPPRATAVAGTLAPTSSPGRHLAGAALQPVRRRARPRRSRSRRCARGCWRRRADLLPGTRLFAAGLRPAAPAARPWTDDRAPVEWITDRMIAAYAMRGADGREQLLAHRAGLTPASPGRRATGAPALGPSAPSRSRPSVWLRRV